MHKMIKSSTGINLVPLNTTLLEHRRVFIEGEITTNGKPLRFYEVYEKTDNRNKKYEVDFLIKQSGKTIPIEVKSANAKEHSSLDYFAKKYKKAINKPIVLTKGDLRETDEYLYLPLAMAIFL